MRPVGVTTNVSKLYHGNSFALRGYRSPGRLRGPVIGQRASLIMATRKSLHLTPTLREVAELRASALNYPSFNAYVKALIRYDALVNGEHTLTRELADMPAHVQDRVDDRCLECCRGGSSERGSLLRKLIHDIVADGGLTA